MMATTWQEWKERVAALEPGLVKFLGTLYEQKGGPGSGNYGHAGRPGQVGGSTPGGGRGRAISQSDTSTNYDSLLKIPDRIAFIEAVFALPISPAEQENLISVYNETHPLPQSRGTTKPGRIWNPSGTKPIDEANEVLSTLPDAQQGQEWAVRFTNDWPGDAKRGYSYADWGVSSYDTRAEAEVDWPKTKIIFDKRMGGFMPVVDGLSSYTDRSAISAYRRLTRWAKGKGWANAKDVYRYMVVYKARHVGFGSDGEDLTTPVDKEVIIFET